MERDYKDTLLMMNTEFSMKANLPTKEPDLVKKWDELDIYKKNLELNKKNLSFILHDGPPYANGNIHIGHALNKILKDILIRFYTMEGYYSPYIPGWDTHGLPIENALTKALKVNRKEVETVAFRKMCREYALKQVALQKEGFKRLGVLGDWEDPYLTLDPKFEAEQLRVFARMASRGLIYKGLKPVYWSPSSESALAEAEIEYYDVKGESIFLGFPVIDGKGVLDLDEEITIWTTTPWTIPANLAVSVNPLYEYVVVKLGEKEDNKLSNRKLVFAKELAASVLKEMGFEEGDYEVVKTIKGRELEYVQYKNPAGKVCPVILGNHVTLDAGTGLVHTAPGFGEDDFNVGRTYGLDVLVNVDSKGFLTEEAGEFAGLFYDNANQVIIENLDSRGFLLLKKTIVHSYPHDWRTKKPIIFRATPQWFASIDALKDDMMKAISEVEWKPSWGDTRIGNMVKDRKEWCISRQRVWGVPIPVFYCENGDCILDEDVILHVASIVEKEGTDAWFSKDAKELLPAGYTHPSSPNGIFTKETDIMDVWFDSGTSHHGVLVARNLPYPADVYLEGSDQYRGWFNSSLSTGVAMTGKAPYKRVITHGFTLDGQGNKMSKSAGNTIDPNQVCKEYGADILRLWVASSEYTADIRVSKDILKQNTEAYRKIRNTFRFLLGNLSDYNNDKDRIEYKDLDEVSKYIECKLNQLLEKCYKAYESLSCDEVYRSVLNYMTNDLSAFYLDFTKDILYIEKYNNIKRRSIQTVLFDNLNALVRLLTPIIPFTCEEIYSFMKNMGSDMDKESVYLLRMVKTIKYDDSEYLLNKYAKFMVLRDDVLKAIEEARNNKIIGKSLASKLIIYPNSDAKELLDSMKCDLERVFIVSSLEIVDHDIDANDYNIGKISVHLCDGITCERCWKIVPSVGEDGLCQRCHEIVNDK